MIREMHLTIIRTGNTVVLTHPIDDRMLVEECQRLFEAPSTGIDDRMRLDVEWNEQCMFSLPPGLLALCARHGGLEVACWLGEEPKEHEDDIRTRGAPQR